MFGGTRLSNTKKGGGGDDISQGKVGLQSSRQKVPYISTSKKDLGLQIGI